MKNPITDQTYSEPTEYVQSLIDAYISTKVQLSQLVDDEGLLLKCMDEAAGFSEETRGKFEIRGTRSKAVIERHMNASYPKNRDESHPLRKLLGMYPNILGELIRVEYKESGQKVQKLIDRLSSPGIGTEEERELIDLLVKARKLSPGKPGVEVKDLKADDVSEPRSSEEHDSGIEEV